MGWNPSTIRSYSIYLVPGVKIQKVNRDFNPRYEKWGIKVNIIYNIRSINILKKPEQKLSNINIIYLRVILY